jgi:NAD(P)-dependent dehydrogenase (short-subunit alcohol dehydrogenase family)
MSLQTTMSTTEEAAMAATDHGKVPAIAAGPAPGFGALAGQRVLVVGASSGMGLSLAGLASQVGATVWMAGRSQERLEAAAAPLTGDVRTAVCDYGDEATVAALRQRVGEVDHLVVTGLDGPSAMLRDYTREMVDDAFGKFWGHFFVARAFADAIPAGGSMVFMSGATALKPPPAGMSVLAAANSAVITLGRALSRELAPVRVNVLVPGIVDTRVWQRIDDETKSAFFSWAERALPVGHIAGPDELSHAMAFLMTNPYTTGSVLVVDGGYVMIGDHTDV